MDYTEFAAILEDLFHLAETKEVCGTGNMSNLSIKPVQPCVFNQRPESSEPVDVAGPRSNACDFVDRERRRNVHTP